MTKPSRILLWLLSALLVSALLAGGFAWYQWNLFKRAQGIERLEWQGLRLSSQGVFIDRLDYVQKTADGLNVAAQIGAVNLQIASFFRPLPPQSLAIERARVTLSALPEASDEPSPPDLER